MRSNNNFDFNGNDISKTKKETVIAVKILIISALVCIMAILFVGCGVLVGSKFGDHDDFDCLDSLYTDIRLQEETEEKTPSEKNPNSEATNLPSNGINDPENTEAKAPEIPENLENNIDLFVGSSAISNSTPFTDVVAHTAKSVVEINTETVTYSQWSGQYIVEGAGSGVIISKDAENTNIYYIVTNDHVIEGAKSITVILHDGNKYSAKLIATDSITDVALIAIEVVPGTELTVATLAHEDNKLLDGQDIFVIGNPLGELGGSVSKGIISKTARNILISGVRMELMQIDAAVNPGNSGGGLFDISGNLIGIVNAKYSEEGIEGLGFAIPINTVKRVILELSQHGYVTDRPGLGFDMAEKTYTTNYFSSTVYPTVTVNKNSVEGTYIDSNGETQSFVFTANDVICSVNGVEINSLAALQSCLLEYEIGDTVTVGVLRKTASSRNYNEYSVTLVLSEYVPAE